MDPPDERRLKAFFPGLAVAVVAVPVAAGLAGTVLPAFGVLPALGGTAFNLEAWRVLFHEPGLPTAIRLTLVTGLGATLVSLLSVALFCAAAHDTRWFGRLQAASAPLLATPHLAIALGFLALASPSGLAVRLVSPWATGWHRPPDIATVNDGWGLAMMAGLVLKEAPFLLLMAVSALNQVPQRALMAAARCLGQPAPVAWLKVVFPLVIRQMRLPVLAVLAYAMSAVDVALLLGPDSPPPLAVLVVRWFFDPDLSRVFPAAAAACLLLALTAAAMLAWTLGGLVVSRLVARWAASGQTWGAKSVRVGSALLPAAVSIGLLSLAATALWSVAGPWRFPDSLPSHLTGASWTAQSQGFARPFQTTLGVALAAVGIALVLSVAALEAVARHGAATRPRLLGLLMLPLLVPQTAFLFGMQVAQLALGLHGGWGALIWAHLVFVLPYVMLALAAPWSALDPRLSQVAAGLGAGRWAVLVRVKLPILLRPLLGALAIGVAVSAGQYLATLFAGGGRMATLATEAVTLASGGDRRVLGVYATLQAAIPLAFFAAALGVPRLVWRRRAGLS